MEINFSPTYRNQEEINDFVPVTAHATQDHPKFYKGIFKAVPPVESISQRQANRLH